jgi:AcrR family transcriptional regulator
VSTDAPDAGARERIVRTAYDLFVQDGLRAVGVDRIIAEAGVAKSTLYRHFSSKDDLVLAVLERRADVWTREWLEREATRRGGTAQVKLLAIFDLYDEWFHRDDYEGCFFVNSLLETGDYRSPVGRSAAKALADIRSFVRQLAEEAHVRDPVRFAARWQLLMLGAIVQADEGHLDAAKDAKAIGRLLLADEVGEPPASRPAGR